MKCVLCMEVYAVFNVREDVENAHMQVIRESLCGLGLIGSRALCPSYCEA